MIGFVIGVVATVIVEVVAVLWIERDRRRRRRADRKEAAEHLRNEREAAVAAQTIHNLVRQGFDQMLTEARRHREVKP